MGGKVQLWPILDCKNLLLQLLLGWVQEKSLSPDSPFMVLLMLFNLYQHPNVCPRRQMHKAASSSSLCPSQCEAIYSISQTWYFGTSLWQTQFRFQHINQTPPHPINADLGTELLFSQRLSDLCVLSLQKFPLSPRPWRQTGLWSW